MKEALNRVIIKLEIKEIREISGKLKTIGKIRKKSDYLTKFSEELKFLAL